MTGGKGKDQIDAGKGNDIVNGNGGADTIFGCNDTVVSKDEDVVIDCNET